MNNKEWRKQNKDKCMNNLWKSMGIPCTYDKYAEMYGKQNGQCAICWEKKKLHVDHDHATGELRDLICNNCNLGLGQFLDSQRLLERAAKYLARHTNKSQIPANIMQGMNEWEESE